jgi:hypothetical protein
VSNYKVTMKGMNFTFGGTIRAGVILCGLAILILAGVETFNKLAAEQARIKEKQDLDIRTLGAEADYYTKKFHKFNLTDDEIKRRLNHAVPELARLREPHPDWYGFDVRAKLEEIDFLTNLHDKFLQDVDREVADSPSIWKMIYMRNCIIAMEVTQTCAQLKRALSQQD